MVRADVEEVDVEPVDLGQELRQGVEPGPGLPPVVVGAPVPGQFLDLRRLDTLGTVVDGLPLGPPCRQDPAAEFGDRMATDDTATPASGIGVPALPGVNGTSPTHAGGRRPPVAVPARRSAALVGRFRTACAPS
jgi:hypothetical protein